MRAGMEHSRGRVRAHAAEPRGAGVVSGAAQQHARVGLAGQDGQDLGHQQVLPAAHAARAHRRRLLLRHGRGRQARADGWR